ncbi:Replication-associated protein like [Argiope bruennichi]|uniref:Replication-associated protein like n=1 Tax=Argiope bruennichi TaxID=94029 RepID=A0A8T0FJ55_ARGBR|nr:Replication-associated protein like [Argiope bruennichi]
MTSLPRSQHMLITHPPRAKQPRVKSGGSAFKDVLSKAESGDITSIKEEHPGIFIRYKTNILSSIKFRTEELTNSCGVWICGPPRCGKDSGVRKLGDVYVKSLNKWWDGYNNQRNVLISDIDPEHGKWLGNFLKIWSDRYAFTAEIKGSSMLIRPSKIFCTSNFLMEDVFSGNILEALKARFNVFNEFDGSFTRRQETREVLSVYNRLLQLEDGLVSSASVSSSAVQEEEVSSSDEFKENKKCSKKKARLSEGNSEN